MLLQFKNARMHALEAELCAYVYKEIWYGWAGRQTDRKADTGR